jgi:hypothetical protein
VLALTGDPRAAALFGIALGITQMIVINLRRLPIAPLQCASVGLIPILSTLTILTRAPFRFAQSHDLLRRVWRDDAARRVDGPAHSPHRVRASSPKLIARCQRVWAGLLLSTGALYQELAFSIDARMVATIMASVAIAPKVTLFAA